MTVYRLLSGLIMVILSAAAAAAQDVSDGQAGDPLDPLCSIIEATARSNALPVDFFTRLIWQESRFHAGLVGPLTHSGAHA